tara:strand:- start:2321 stop:6235 length:3915 start_codon:yes stop_codon:yes gene_type:complete
MAGRCLGVGQPDSWRLKPLDGTDDFGLDYQVQTVVDGQVRDIFRVQLKGTAAPDASADGSFFSIQLKASTVRYYEGITEPILLVLCDLSGVTHPTQGRLYFCWIEDELRRLNAADMPALQQYVTFRIPAANRLLPDTDLSAHLSHSRAVSKSARAIDAIVQAARPDLSEDARADFLSRVAGGLEARGYPLVHAIAEPATTPWPEAPTGSFAWHLKEAAHQLRSGDADAAQDQLKAAAMLAGPHTALELAERSFLEARVHALCGDEDAARTSYEDAVKLSANQPRYLAAWLESELRCRHRDGRASVDDLIRSAEQADQSDASVNSVRSRLLAIAGRLVEGLAVAASIQGFEGHAAAAIIHTMSGQSHEALQDCDAGLAEPNVPERSQLLFLILRARARFRLALQEWFASTESEILPMSGPAGADLGLLQIGWADIEAAVLLLMKHGWPQNVEFIADVWASSASILGRGEQSLPLLLQAARARPSYPTLQSALETLAVATGELEYALEANARLPVDGSTQLRRIALLHMDGQHAECIELFERALSGFDHTDNSFPSVVASAALSADKMVRSDLADRWAEILGSRPEWAAQSALLAYFRRVLASPLERESAVNELIAQFDALASPPDMGMLVLNELDPASDSQATVIIRIAGVVQTRSLLPVELAVKLAHALVTKERWDDLRSFASDCIRRLGARSKFGAFQALALDRLGQTPDAITLLEALLEGSDVDSLALDTFVNIAVRCGMTEGAIRSVETLLARSSRPERRLECLRLLFGLLHRTNPTDPRCVDVAWRIGRQSRPDHEEEEGLFLVTMFAATLYVPLLDSDPRLPEMQRRVQDFTQRFPESRILRSEKLPEESSPDALLEMLKRISGYDESREEWRRSVELQLSRGAAPVPYAWRPKVILHNIPDVPTLWEFSKRSNADQQELHLQMVPGAWERVSASQMRGRVPLLDMTTLQVVHDLGIFELLFHLFPKIAIGQRTLVELAQLCSPMTGSFVRDKCLSIQGMLKSNVNRIMQPLADLHEKPRRAQFEPLEEIKQLAQRSDYVVYSDDALFRIYCSVPAGAKAICTLDILSALDEGGWLTPQAVAEKLAKLCMWHVGLSVIERYQLAALPDALGAVRDIPSGVAALRSWWVSNAIFGGIWGGSRPYVELRTEAGQLLRRLISDSENSVDSISALMALWHEKSRLRSDAPTPPVLVAVQLLVQAAILSSPPSTTEAVRLWAVFRALVENEYGAQMDERKEQDAIALAAEAAAQVDVSQAPKSATSLRSRLLQGLTAGTQDEATFGRAYDAALVAAATTAAKKK